MKRKMTINPRVDFAFKKIFGSEENHDLLLSLVNSVLPEEDQVAELTLLNPYTLQSFETDKLSILDIKAKDKKGRFLNIEMQITDQLSYEKRALFLWSKLFSEQLQKGQSYSELKKTIGIHILNFNILDEIDFHNIYAVLNLKSKKRQFEELQLHVIELEKFNKEYPDVKTGLDRWVTFLKRAQDLDRKTLPKSLSEDKEVVRAIEVLEKVNFTEMERKIYDSHWIWLMDEASALEKKYQIGREEGREEGKAEGEEMGYKKRDEEAKKEKHEQKCEMARKMKAKGLSILNISEITGLKKEELKGF